MRARINRAVAAGLSLVLMTPAAWAQNEVVSGGRALYQFIMQCAGIVLLVGLVAGLIFSALNMRGAAIVAGSVFFVALLIAGAATILRLTGLPIFT